jgi:hypothetical protein
MEEVEVGKWKPEDKLWIPYKSVGSGKMVSAVVITRYDVCESDMWQSDPKKQKEVLATCEVKTLLKIDARKHVIAESDDVRVSSTNHSGELYLEGTAEVRKSSVSQTFSGIGARWGKPTGGSSSSVHVLGTGHVLTRITPDKDGKGCWLVYWVSNHASHRQGLANDNVGAWLWGPWNPDLFVDIHTAVRIVVDEEKGGTGKAGKVGHSTINGK